MAFERFGDGYGGPLGVMVGFDVTRDALSGIGITTMRETPGVITSYSIHYTKLYEGRSGKRAVKRLK